MPRFSICVPSYNNAQYLDGCVRSVLAQDYTDYELIVVNDGSEDNTGELISSLAGCDSRVVAVDRQENLGRHLTRQEAVDRASGDYVLFLDSDDELMPGFLGELNSILQIDPVDVLHFGVKVADCGVGSDEAGQFEAYVNAPLEELTGDSILSAVYSPREGGYRQDWRITQRVYSSALIKRSFDSMVHVDLGRAEDAYESFVVLSMASRSITRNDIVGLLYNYGRGVNSGSPLTVSDFAEDAGEFWSAIKSIEDYAHELGTPFARECAEGARDKLFDLLFNDWMNRLPAEGKIAAVQAAASKSSYIDCAVQLMRLVRDAAYSSWITGGSIDESASYLEWYDCAREMAGNEAALSQRYQSYLAAARGHIDDLRRRTRLTAFNDQDVRIFVSTHKRVDLFDSKMLQPVQVGCALRDFRYDWALHDDEGENISTLNPMYCELTSQYWAWKNVDAPYIGFCHYRRYFDFADVEHQQNPFGEVMDARIDAESQAKYCLDDASISKVLEGVDIVTTVVQDIRSYLGPNATLRSQYNAADHLYVEDLDHVVDILIKYHPEYAEDARAFLAGHTGCFCNMFIMKRDIFRAYCEWLFPLLEEFVDTTDMSKYSREGVRTPGHLSERLLNIYLNHQLRHHPEWKVKRLQCVHFTQPDYNPGMKMPVHLDDRRQVVPIVFASDNNYVPMLTTTVYSMLCNASPDYRYDITVLHRDIAGENQRIIREFLSRFENAEISFCDVSQAIEKFNLTTNNPHISVETYYRFLIQELLPHYDKVLYLDSDLIVEGDVSELFAVDLKDSLLAAAHDIDFVANVNMKRGDRLDYARDILGMNDPYGYFQAGVLVLNTRAMRSEYSMEQWLEFASDERFIYNDQDVLNAHCEGKVVYLDYDWNVMIDCCGRIGNVFSFAPAGMLDAYMDSRNHEKIVHYAGVQKPWKQGGCDRDELYWQYARETPFYERLLMMSMSPATKGHRSGYLMHDPAISPSSKLRKYIDPIAPLGSARREFAKSVVRKIRGIK